MKSLDFTPTNENVYNSLINDSIGRGEFVRQFVKMLNAIEDNCTIALEGNWGSGKTFFVKQVKMVLDAHNPNYQPVNGFLTEERRKIIKEKCSEFNAEDGSTELKPQYITTHGKMTMMKIRFFRWFIRLLKKQDLIFH